MEILSKHNKMLIWFMGEIIQIIVFTMGSIMLLWLYAPFGLVTKGILTMLAGVVTYDMFKHFVYVRWILYKETLYKKS